MTTILPLWPDRTAFREKLRRFEAVHAMRHYYLIAILALLAPGVCLPAPPPRGESPPDASGSPATLDQTYTKSMVGTWELTFPDGGEQVQIELRADGRWKWWAASPQADYAPYMAQSGRWFIRERTCSSGLRKRPIHLPLDGLR